MAIRQLESESERYVSANIDRVHLVRDKTPLMAVPVVLVQFGELVCMTFVTAVVRAKLTDLACYAMPLP
jgi:hypothetical protein